MAPKHEEYINQTFRMLAVLSLENQSFTAEQFYKKLQADGFQGGETEASDCLRALKRWSDFGITTPSKGVYQLLPCYQWQSVPDADWLKFNYKNCKDIKKYPDCSADLHQNALLLLKGDLAKLCTQECAASRLGISTSELNSMLRGKKPMPTSIFLGITSIIRHLESFFRRNHG